MLEFLLIILVLLIIIVLMYNSIISLKNKANNAKASIDVYLKKRFDLLPNLINCVKGYQKYEKDVLAKVTKIRTMYTGGTSSKNDVKLNDDLNKLLIKMEAYPDLKASESFVNLQKQLGSLEDEIEASRRFYNSAVTEYNSKIQTIPFNVIAMLFSLKEMELFTAKEEEKKKVKVDFNN